MGSTWVVIAVVVAAILTMAFFANLVVIAAARAAQDFVLCSATCELGDELMVLVFLSCSAR